MVESAIQTKDAAPPPRGSGNPLGALVHGWQRISPRFVPVLAVVTALLITVPFMILTGGRGNFARGVEIAGTAYSALLEGSLGLAINDTVSRDDFNSILALAQSGPINRGELRSLSRALTALNTIGFENARRYGEALALFPDADDETLAELAESIPDLATIGLETLDAMRPLVSDLDVLPRGDVRALAERYAGMDTLGADERAALEAVAPSAAEFSDEDLLRYMGIVDAEGVVKLGRLIRAADMLNAQNLAPDAPAVADLAGITALQDGVSAARTAAQTAARLDAAGITNPLALQEQVEIVRSLYDQRLFTGDDVVAALNTQLEAATSETLLVRRPGNRLLVARSGAPAGVIVNDSNTPDNPADDKPEAAYLRLGSSALLFFPSNLEAMLVRAIPFIIAGLAVALGFKAGLFNIGAEGQVYIGTILAVGFAFSPTFAGLPWFIHLPLVIVIGIFGGALWGAIPGTLKAFTGAHEVIVTIMLNYVAIRLVDWLIKSTDPVILLDVTASTPRTPFILESAVMPRFSAVPSWLFIAAGVFVLLIGLWRRREQIQRDLRFAIRPAINGLLVAIGGLFLAWITVRGQLHLGLVLMLLAVRFTDWFLNRTTPGFELRTVGTNPDAARYAGMSVRGNIILALSLSGALAGLAGTIELTAVQLNMQPEFFSGLGFDAIAVALLARTNPRNMIWAGLIWGSLLAGAGLMQLRANISIDLVKIIQALIIMFIAADAIIRTIWRVPKPTEKTVTTFSKGWGS